MVRLRFDVDAEGIKREILGLMEQELGKRRGLVDKEQVEALVDEAIRACTDLVPPRKGESSREVCFIGHQFLFGMYTTRILFLVHSKSQRIYVFPEWHSMHRCTARYAAVMKEKTHVMSPKTFYCRDLAHKLSSVILYDECRRAGERELSEGLKKRKEKRKRQRELVREGCYDVEEDILKEYIKERYVRGRIMIQYRSREFCLFSEIYGDEDERGYHQWFVNKVYALHRVSGEERLLSAYPEKGLVAEKALSRRQIYPLLKMFARSDEVNEEDRRMIRMLIAFEEL